MRAVCSQSKLIVSVFIFNLCFCASYQLTQLQVCELCGGTVPNNDTAVGRFCTLSAGRTDGRCCLRRDDRSDFERIIGLDLSNCSLTHVENIQEASKALLIDLSLNPIVNISDSAFQGFIQLSYLILPPDLVCPGGNASWEKVEVKEGNHYCEGQKNTCNQTGQPFSCPENSLCGPYGPGFFECSCSDSFHGYKCLREGEFPALKVFGPLGASTLVVALLLWVTQRREVKSL